MSEDGVGEDVTSRNEKDKTDSEYQASHQSRFRFKDKSKRRDHERSHEDDDREHRRRRHHHRSKRRRTSPSSSKPKDDPSLYDDTHLPNTSSSSYLNPDVAFRESLFDAMADDEGAAFWEGVYGQPIHTYPDVKKGPDGELERMTDEEYTAFVRAKMYEKTHQHLLEEKARREERKKERERLAREGEREEREAERFRRRVEESLKRGQERRKGKAWGEKWEAYLQKWEKLGKGSADANGGEKKVAIASIPWPVESGRRKDVSTKEVEKFFLHAPTAGKPTEGMLGRTLKFERVRWHPDKIQQKLGGQDVSEEVIQAVTEVFQVIDTMWSEMRDRKI